jgi:uncharacterized integral membrane protein
VTQEPSSFDTQPPAKERDIGPAMIIAAFILILAVIFIFQNTDTSAVSFLWLELEAPTWVWFFILFLVGVAAGWFGHMIRIRRQAKKLGA